MRPPRGVGKLTDTALGEETIVQHASDPESVVRAACEAIWTDGEVDRVPEFYAEHFEADYTFTDWGKGQAGVATLAAGIRASFPDYREQIDELHVAGKTVTVILTIRGTHTGDRPGFPATGREVEFRDVSLIDVEDGRITRQRGLSDLLTHFVQLGLVTLPGQ